MTSATQFPWYIHAVEISRPLHFGDYGGLPLKILWAALDLIAIAVLVSGIVLWVSKGKASRTDAEAIPRVQVQRSPRSFAQVYRWPALLAVASICGLFSALMGDGLWDAASWCLLLPCVLACLLWLLKKRLRGRNESSF